MSIDPQTARTAHHRLYSIIFYVLSAFFLIAILATWWSFYAHEDLPVASGPKTSMNGEIERGITDVLEPSLPRKNVTDGTVMLQKLTGSIVKIDNQEGYLRIITPENVPYSVGVSPDTNISIDDKKVNLQSLHTGLIVDVVTTELTDTQRFDFFAESIHSSTEVNASSTMARYRNEAPTTTEDIQQ